MLTLNLFTIFLLQVNSSSEVDVLLDLLESKYFKYIDVRYGHLSLMIWLLFVLWINICKHAYLTPCVYKLTKPVHVDIAKMIYLQVVQFG